MLEKGIGLCVECHSGDPPCTTGVGDIDKGGGWELYVLCARGGGGQADRKEVCECLSVFGRWRVREEGSGERERERG